MRRRQGFTLVELMVSMALIIFIMAILSTAFSAAMTTFRNLKATGDLAERLRATVQLLQRDLAADHFESKKRLSDLTFWQNGPPQQGFFQILQGSAALSGSADGYLEGTDTDLVGSYINVDHALAFTIKLNGNQMSDFLSAMAPTAFLTASANFGPAEARYQSSAGPYNYQWAEVAWFLQPSYNLSEQTEWTASDTIAQSQSSGTAGNPYQLYTLYRRQRLAVPDNSLVNPPIPIIDPNTNTNNYAQCLELSCWGNLITKNLHFNSPSDLTMPDRRFGGQVGIATGNPTFTNALPTRITVPSTTIAQDLAILFPPPNVVPANLAALKGADIQLTNVVSFDVRVLTPDTLSSTDSYVVNSGLQNWFVDPFVTLGSTSGNGTYFNPGQTYTYPADISWLSKNALIFDTWSSLNDSIGPSYQQWNSPSGLNAMPYWLDPAKPPSVTGFPKGPTIQALQITIRIWDPKTNQTRQVTVVQAM